MSFTTCLVVMIGGALGTLARYVVAVLALPISRDLPWGTIIINRTCG
jgi:CrcB protein